MMTRDELHSRLVRVGELLISSNSHTELDSYFDSTVYRLHGPDGFETNYSGTLDYFKAIRSAFDNRSMRRGITIAEGEYAACQTWIEGRFVREFTYSPAGPLAPNGQDIVWDLINIFRFDAHGLLVEEWIRSDNRSLLRQLGAPGK
jgi:SnoaL-like polyketide cyclase